MRCRTRHQTKTVSTPSGRSFSCIRQRAPRYPLWTRLLRWRGTVSSLVQKFFQRARTGSKSSMPVSSPMGTKLGILARFVQPQCLTTPSSVLTSAACFGPTAKSLFSSEADIKHSRAFAVSQWPHYANLPDIRCNFSPTTREVLS